MARITVDHSSDSDYLTRVDETLLTFLVIEPCGMLLECLLVVSKQDVCESTRLVYGICLGQFTKPAGRKK